jgi:hypothetical protein
MKRQELIDFLNLEIKKEGSAIRFQSADVTPSIDIVVKDPFVLSHSMINKTGRFFQLVEDLVRYKTKLFRKNIQWNNTYSCFSLWKDEQTNYFEDCQ